MNNQILQDKKIKRLLILLLVFLGIFIFWRVYEFQQFHVINTNPKTSKVTIITPFLKVNFNDVLDSKNLSVSSQKGVIKTYSVSGKILTIQFNDVLQSDKTYTVTVHSVQNTKGEQIKNKVFKFTPVQSNFDQLPKDQQKALLAKQDNYTSSPLNDPIVQHLPHSTLDYNLTLLLNTDAAKKQTITLEAQLLLSQSDVNIDQNAAVDQYKQEVIDYIQSLGLDPAKYTIQYSIAYL